MLCIACIVKSAESSIILVCDKLLQLINGSRASVIFFIWWMAYNRGYRKQIYIVIYLVKYRNAFDSVLCLGSNVKTMTKHMISDSTPYLMNMNCSFIIQISHGVSIFIMVTW